MAQKKTTEKKTKSTKAAKSKARKPAASKEKQKIARIFLVLFIICFGAVLLGFGFWGLSKVLFSKNERLILRQVKVSGLPAGRIKALNKYLEIYPGVSNLYDIELAKTKSKIQKISYIKSASVYRELPDTLKIKIIQRTPLAYLQKYKAKWLVDEDSIIMHSRFCMKVKYPLPVIRGFSKTTLKSGRFMPGIQQALKLIELTKYKFRDFSLSSIDLSEDKKMTFVMISKRRAYKVIIPDKGLDDSLIKLHYAIDQKQGRHQATIDLTFNNQVIFR